MTKRFSRKLYEFKFYEDRNGMWRARIQRSGIKDVLVGPVSDRATLFMEALKTLNQAELQTIMLQPWAPGERPLYIEAPESVVREATEKLMIAMRHAVEEAVSEFPQGYVAQVVPEHDPLLDGVACLLVGHGGEKLARVSATYDEKAKEYRYRTVRLETPRGPLRPKTRSKRNPR